MLSCPATQTLQAATNEPVQAIFPAPLLRGGTSPVTTACTPPSGASFPIGSTTVTCTVADAAHRTNTCGFSVTVVPPLSPPRLGAMSFLVFGDSITEGKTARGTLHSLASEACNGVPLPGNYAETFSGLLSGRYSGQSFQVKNCGLGGERALDGLVRLPLALAQYTPQVLLLLEGANDVNVDPRNTASIFVVVDALRLMIRLARERNVTVFVGTLLPERLHGTPPRGDAAASIPLANQSIHSMAENEGAIVVDLYEAFGSTADPALIDIDGLHPTAAGHQLIAKSFFESVRARLDIVSQSRR
jgi:lysophospholipase L1-like esterase